MRSFHRRGATSLLDLAEEASTDPWTKWGQGAILPGLGLLYAASIGWSGMATCLSRQGHPRVLYGAEAYCVAGVVLAVAGFFHCHAYWGNTHRLAGAAPLGKVVCGMAGLACLIGLLASSLHL